MPKESKLKRRVREILRNCWELTELEDGTFQYEIYADYRDELSLETVKELCEDSNPLEAFRDYIWETYEEYVSMHCEANIDGTVREKLKEYYPDGLSEQQETDLDEILKDLVTYVLPYDHFLDQLVEADIYVNTGDGNYDFSLNDICFQKAEKDEEVSPKTSIRWLAETQGYSEKQLRHVLKNGEYTLKPKDFMESIYGELCDCAGYNGQLVFLAKMKVRDILAVNEIINRLEEHHMYDPNQYPDCGMIHISKNVWCGLYDRFNGAGGGFDVKLEKDIDLPVKLIHMLIPDKAKMYGGWSIGDCYGFCGYVWQEDVADISGIHMPEEKKIA